MLTSKRSSEPAGSYGNLPPTFPACFVSPSCPIRRGLRLSFSPPTPPCPRRSAPHLLPPVPSAGTSSTRPTWKPDLISTTNFLDGPSSTIWTWGRWVSIASSIRATTRRWVTAADEESPPNPRILLELLLQRRLHPRGPSNVSNPAAARSSMVPCRYPAAVGSSRARTLRERC